MRKFVKEEAERYNFQGNAMPYEHMILKLRR